MRRHSCASKLSESHSSWKKHYGAFFTLLLVHFFCPLNGHAGTVSLGPEKDTALISSGSKDEADGGEADRLYAQKTQAFALLDFDLGSIAAPITGAVLKLTQLTNNTGNWDFQVYPMVYQANNYSWIEGSGTNPNPSDSTNPADSTGAASYRYRLNGTTDLAWKTATGTNLTNAAAGSALWATSIGTKSGTNYVSGTQISITLNASALEQFRIGDNKHVTLGVYDATPSDFTLANNNFFGSRENTTPSYRPVLEVTSASTLVPGALFQNRMVLQRDQPIQFWGRGTVGRTVTVSLDGQTIATTTVSVDGNWATAATARSSDGGISHTVKITQSGGEAVTYSDVVMGDVYLAAGQSNIARLMNATHYPEELSTDNLPLIRQTTIKVQAAATEQSEAGIQTPWTIAVRSNLNSFSHTGYFFAKNLHLANGGVPVGIILAADGGQEINRFLSIDGLAAVPELAGLKKHVELGGLTEYYDYFNGMIAPLNPYRIKGFIWYQGEASVTDGDIYRLKMRALVRGWRELWNVPFYYVQLPNYSTKENWTELRNVQRRFLSDEPDLGMVVTIDVGDDADLHPVNKQDVGARLALWARRQSDGSVFASGPLYNGHTVQGAQIRVSFIRANGGLRVGTKSGTDPVVFTTNSLENFEIAGTDLVFYPATATIDGYDVLVSSPSVTAPVHVRYCHQSAPVGGRKLYNAKSLPASPFRTDESYILDVNSGIGGSALVRPGQIKTITAANPPAGKVFDRWLGATTELASPTSATTTITMPARGVYLLATYR